MKLLDRGEDKVAKICEVLRQETIEPAKQESERIIEDAKNQGEKIIQQAEAEAKKIVEKARAQAEHERALLDASFTQAARQSIEQLKQEIERSLFNPALSTLLDEKMRDPKVIADLISSIIKALEKEGLATDMTALITKHVDPKAVNQLLTQEILKRLKTQSVQIGSFAGGAQLVLEGKRMRIDMREEVLIELMSGFLREGFRKFFFVSQVS